MKFLAVVWRFIFSLGESFCQQQSFSMFDGVVIFVFVSEDGSVANDSCVLEVFDDLPKLTLSRISTWIAPFLSSASKTERGIGSFYSCFPKSTVLSRFVVFFNGRIVRTFYFVIDFGLMVAFPSAYILQTTWSLLKWLIMMVYDSFFTSFDGTFQLHWKPSFLCISGSHHQGVFGLVAEMVYEHHCSVLNVTLKIVHEIHIPRSDYFLCFRKPAL